MLELKVDTIRAIIYSTIPLAGFLILWELLSGLAIIKPALFSSPSEIFLTIIDMAIKGELWQDIFTSLYRLIISFILAAVIGIGVGLLMGWSSLVHDLLDPIITFLMPIPGIAWTPIFLVWFGFGDPTLIPVGILVTFFPIVQNVAAATKAIDQKMVWAARSLGANHQQVISRVLLPHSSPYLLTGFKLGLARGWRTIIAVELIAGSKFGLGAMIFTAREFLQPYKIYAGIIMLAILYFSIELLIKLIERVTIERWGMIDVGVFHEQQ
ncbi:MAG: ABC transporter permease [Promethearchaeota archaeon]